MLLVRLRPRFDIKLFISPQLLHTASMKLPEYWIPSAPACTSPSKMTRNRFAAAANESTETLYLDWGCVHVRGDISECIIVRTVEGFAQGNEVTISLPDRLVQHITVDADVKCLHAIPNCAFLCRDQRLVSELREEWHPDCFEVDGIALRDLHILSIG